MQLVGIRQFHYYMHLMFLNLQLVNSKNLSLTMFPRNINPGNVQQTFSLVLELFSTYIVFSKMSLTMLVSFHNTL